MPSLVYCMRYGAMVGLKMENENLCLNCACHVKAVVLTLRALEMPSSMLAVGVLCMVI